METYQQTATMDIDVRYVTKEADENNDEINIIEIVAIYYNLNVDDLKKKTRMERVRLPRQIAMFLYRKLTQLSTKAIGLLFNRDHATVLHSVKTVRNLIETGYKNVAMDIKELEEIIKTQTNK